MQQMENHEISGTEYQQGTLAGCEVKEYLLEKWGRKCAYCGASGVGPKSVLLEVEHIHPRSKGGSDRVSNLALACTPCNQAKDNRPVEELLAHDPKRLKAVQAQAKAPLHDAAAVNTTRWALWRALSATGLPTEAASGGRTKWNRSRLGIPKSHTLDALCVGDASGVSSYPDRIITAKATGRGGYARTRPDRFGFPRLRFPRTKSLHGFTTGDLVRAVVPKGKRSGAHVGYAAVRSSGSLCVGDADGISYKHCLRLQRGDGWEIGAEKEEPGLERSATAAPIPPRPDGRDLPAQTR